MSDSDSDRTVDSDELGAIMGKPLSQERLALRSTKLHDISDDSESSDNESKPLEDNTSIKSVEKRATQPTADDRPLCKYGSNCYRKNPEHHRQFQHQKEDDNPVPDNKRMKLDHEMMKKTGNFQQISNFNFFFTTVSGIDPKYNQRIAQNIRDLLKPSEGKLKASVQFNYMVDVPWLINQYPPEFRNCPLLIVHGEQRRSKHELEKSAKSFPNITFCQAKLEIMYGTHHTKMMLLLYEDGLRVIVHTSNLIDGDWYQKTQGLWVSPKFPPLPVASVTSGESCTRFKADLIEYLSAYKDSALYPWCETVKRHDMSSARVFLIGSVPGRHIGSQKTQFGHLKLRKVLAAHGTSSLTANWPVIGQFSSIGSLGSNPNQWLCGEWLTSLATVKGVSLTQNVPLKLIFPSVDNVRTSLEGYPAGASLPYSKSTASKQPYLTSFLHHWKSSQFGRSYASPHIKSYCRIDPDMTKIAWFLVTSANLSKAAWGALEKSGTQLMIRSYELGVLFIPHFLCGDNYFLVNAHGCNNTKKFPLPFDVPLIPYKPSDEPWIWDTPHREAPDRHGNMWCPPG